MTRAVPEKHIINFLWPYMTNRDYLDARFCKDNDLCKILFKK